MDNLEYAGFWIRVGASLIDTLLLLIIIGPILTMIYGSGYWLGESSIIGFWDILLNYILPGIVVILFWSYKSATPGKMMFKLAIVDATSGEKPSTRQLIVRYLCYYVSIIPLLLGIFWVGIDKKKQGWHDMIANTVVVR
ncbi:MAG: putative RDD family membrane protein YckC, partial [Paraglaciecola sp.]